MDTLEQMKLCGLIPVVAPEQAECAVPISAALDKASIPIMGISMRSEAACDAILRVRQERPDFLVGAYGVLNASQAERAIDVGANFIITPGLNTEVARLCQGCEMTILPGCATPSDMDAALALGIHAVHLFPAGALGGVPLVQSLSAAYTDACFLPDGGVSAENFTRYLALPAVTACVCDWLTPADAIRAGDWDFITALAFETVQTMLGFTLAHVGVNSGSEAEALQQAQEFCEILGWAVRPGNSSVFAGKIVEFVKNPWTGTHGHIAIGVNEINRAWWHLEKCGVEFDWENAKYKGDQLAALYLQKEIGGFAVHLQQKS